ncbi:MAG: hypothetical protein WAW07_06470 [Bacteroidales bacterium]
MKTLFSIIFPVVIIGFFLLQVSPLTQTGQQSGSAYPDNVKKIIDSKCYGCHKVDGKSQDAKDALMWDSLPGLQKSRVIATLDDIIKVLEKNEMPPSSVVKKYPEMKLLSEESKIMQSWARSWVDSLLK